MKFCAYFYTSALLSFALCISYGSGATNTRSIAKLQSHYDDSTNQNYSAGRQTNDWESDLQLTDVRYRPRQIPQHTFYDKFYGDNPSHPQFRFPAWLNQYHGDFRADSCMHRCDTRGHDVQLPCQCNTKCMDFNDCCNDYQSACLTCSVERCKEDAFNSDLPCQCNKACRRHNDCCTDYLTACNNNGGSVSVTDADLQTLSEALLTADVNNCADLVTVSQQGSTSFHSHRDNAPLPLLTVQPSAYNKPTIVKLLPLYNNYVATVADAEVVTSQETQEETAFLDVIMPTSVMKKAEKFLIDKGLISNRKRLANGSYRNNNRAFRDAIHQIWFGLYSRENRTLGSSGFEHVFLGEIKQEKVQGFHNWVFFSKEEQNNNLNYKGKIGPNVSLGNKGMIVKHKFDWINREKPISSMFVGTSPEFEIALYTVCFYARPGARCPVKLNGKDVNIQTHYSYRQGKRYVGSAFPDI